MAKTFWIISFVWTLAVVTSSASPTLLENANHDLRREAMLLLVREPLSLNELRDLSAIHDVIALKKLDRAFERRFELRQTLGWIAPRALDQELVDTLLGIERLASDLAETRAREILERLPSKSPPAVVSRIVLARRGDISVIREALTHYFEDAETWGEILSEGARFTKDPRLQDFLLPTEPRAVPHNLPLFQTELERRFADSRQKWKLGEMLFWAEKKRSLVAARLLSHMPQGTLHEEWITHILAEYAASLKVGDNTTDATRLRALAALGWRRANNRADVLLRALAGDDPLAASVSALALGKMPSAEAHPALRDKALSGDPDVAAASAAALIELGGKEEALGLIKKRNPWELLGAAPILEVLDGRLAPDAAAIAELMDRIVDTEARLPLLRRLAERDDPALAMLDLEGSEVDRLYPYLARSEVESLRALVLEVGRDSRGAALAALLLSPTASRAEKMEAAKDLGEAWPEAVNRGGPRAIEALERLDFWERRREEVFFPEQVTSAWIAAVSQLPGDDARKAIERIGTAKAIEQLAKREDRLHALPALSRLKREGDESVREAAEMILLSLNAPGSSEVMQKRLDRPETLRALVPFSNGTAQAAEVLAAVAVGDDLRPDVQASLFALYRDRPQEYLGLLDISDPSAHRRVHSTLALSDNPARLPVLMDVAALEERQGSRTAALRGLADPELGRDAFRLHRSAGDPDREVRFAVAAALVPSGDVWAMRLMMAEMNREHPWERLAVLKAIRRLPQEEAQSLLEELFRDGTGNAFSNNLLFEILGGVSEEQEPRAWELVATHLDESPYALLIAARLDRIDAVRAVIERLE